MTLDRPNSPPDLDALLAHSGWVRKLARVLANGNEFADDTEQEAWRIAMERPPAHGSNLRGWWTRVVQSASVQRQRSEGRHRRWIGKMESGSQPPTVERPDEVAERMENVQVLARLVHELDEPFGSTVYLHYFEGLSTTKIAQQQDVPKATVQSRLRRGVARLRTQLKKVHGEDWRNQCLALAFPVSSATAISSAATVTSIFSALIMKTQFKALLIIAAISSVGVLAFWEPDGSVEDTPLKLNAQVAEVETPNTDSDDSTIQTPVADRQLVVTPAQGATVPEPVHPWFILPEGRERDAWLEFEVLDSEGSPWVDLPMDISARPSFATPDRYFQTDSNGVIRVPCISSQWSFRVTSDQRDGGNGIDLDMRMDLDIGETKRFTVNYPARALVSGTVFDADGKGIPEIKVRYSGDSFKKDVNFDELMVTNADGHFQFRGIEGRYTVRTISKTLPELYISGIVNKEQLANDLEFHYPPTRLVNLKVLRGDSPVPDASLYARNYLTLKETSNWKLTHRGQRHGPTNPEGKAEIPAFRDMEWPIELGHPEFGQFVVTLPPEVEDYVFQIPSGASIQGNVIDSSGEPIVGARVRAWGIDEGVDSKLNSKEVRFTWPEPDWPWREATTDKDGNFRIHHLPESSKGTVLAEADGMAYFGVQSITFPNSSEGLIIQMHPSLPISGQLRDHEDRPIESRTVEIQGHPCFGSSTAWKNFSYIARTYRIHTDPNGMFHFPGLEAGTWTIKVHSNGPGFDPAALVSISAGTDDLVIHLGDGLDSRINITATVVDAITKQPITDLRALLVKPSIREGRVVGGGGSTVSHSEMSNKIEVAGKEVHEYVLQISSPGYAQWRKFIPAKIHSYSFEAELIPVFPTELQIENSDHELISDLPIRVFSNDGQQVVCGTRSFVALNELGADFFHRTPKTDENGLISLEGIPHDGGYFLIGGGGIRPSLEIPFHYQPSEPQVPKVITLPQDFLEKWEASAK